MGDPRQALPAPVDLPSYRSRGVAVSSVVARDAYRVGKVGRDERRVQTDRQGFLADPAFAELSDRTGTIGSALSRQYAGMFQGGDRLAGTRPVAGYFDGSLDAPVAPAYAQRTPLTPAPARETPKPSRRRGG